MGNHLTKKEGHQVTDLLIKYENVFAFSMKDLGKCKTMQCSIDLIDKTPMYRRRHRLSKHEWELVDERCKELHEVGLIQSSSFNFATTTIMPAKKDSTILWIEKKMCEDYRPLNLVTHEDKYPMPIPEELFNSIGNSNIFTIVDLRQGFGKLCSPQRITRKQHSMEVTSCGNGLRCLLDWRMHLFSFSESWTKFLKGQISWNATWMMFQCIARDSYSTWFILRSYSRGSTKSIWKRSILKSVNFLSPQYFTLEIEFCQMVLWFIGPK